MVDKSHVIFHCMNAYGPKKSRKHTRTDCLSQPFERRLVQKQLPEGKMMLCPRHMSAESRFHDQSHRGF